MPSLKTCLQLLVFFETKKMCSHNAFFDFVSATQKLNCGTINFTRTFWTVVNRPSWVLNKRLARTWQTFGYKNALIGNCSLSQAQGVFSSNFRSEATFLVILCRCISTSAWPQVTPYCLIRLAVTQLRCLTAICQKKMPPLIHWPSLEKHMMGK